LSTFSSTAPAASRAAEFLLVDGGAAPCFVPQPVNATPMVAISATANNRRDVGGLLVIDRVVFPLVSRAC